MFETDCDQDLKTILIESVKINKNTGSSTCVLAKFHAEAPILKTTNLGDSGYAIYTYEKNGIYQKDLPHADPKKVTKHRTDKFPDSQALYWNLKFRSKEQ